MYQPSLNWFTKTVALILRVGIEDRWTRACVRPLALKIATLSLSQLRGQCLLLWFSLRWPSLQGVVASGAVACTASLELPCRLSSQALCPVPAALLWPCSLCLSTFDIEVSPSAKAGHPIADPITDPWLFPVSPTCGYLDLTAPLPPCCSVGTT